MNEDFNGVIQVDVRDSVPDWAPYELKRAPEGAPNVLVVLYDDTGLAAWSPYGGRINMPTMDRLAAGGLTYTQWHTTALCSPTRSTFLTGRNHHVNRCATIMEATDGFPGAAGRLPAECATIGHLLQDNGFSTFWVGKDHNVPEEDNAPGGSRSMWPLQLGFDRFYGFLGGETNNWYPDLVEDNHFIEAPATPEEGYHLSKDLADQALEMLSNQQASNPSKPWYLWFCPGANHAPHHAPEEYIAKYDGAFDDGYEAYREWVLGRMIEKGIMPAGTELTPLNPMPEEVANEGDFVRPWDDAERRRATPVRPVRRGLRRLLGVHRRAGRPDHRLPGGDRAAREHADLLLRRQRGVGGGEPERLGQREQVLQRLPRRPGREPRHARQARQPGHLQPLPDGLGGGLLHALPDVQAVLPVLRRHLRPHGDPLAPGHRGERRGPPPVPPLHRHRRHHPRRRRPGDARHLPRGRAAPARRRLDAQQLRRRRRPHHQARAVLRHARHPRHLEGRLEGRRHPRPDQRQGQLRPGRVGALPRRRGPFGVAGPRRRAPREAPGAHRRLVRAGEGELRAPARRPGPRRADHRSRARRPSRPRDRYVYHPGTAAVPESVAVNVRGRSYKIIADAILDEGRRGSPVRARVPLRRARAVHQGQASSTTSTTSSASRRSRRSRPRSSRPGRTRSAWSSSARAPASTASPSARASSTSTTTSSPKGRCGPRSGKFTLCGDGLCVGYDSADTVSRQYTNPFPFTGGKLLGVAVDVSGQQYLDLELEAAAMLSRE